MESIRTTVKVVCVRYRIYLLFYCNNRQHVTLSMYVLVQDTFLCCKSIPILNINNLINIVYL